MSRSCVHDSKNSPLSPTSPAAGMDRQGDEIPILALTCDELSGLLRHNYGKGDFHAAALCREICKKGNVDFAAAPEFAASKALTRRLVCNVRLPECRIVVTEEDGVTKFATRLFDGHVIETVVIPAEKRTTLCVSSQVGCTRGCRFCTTATMGLVRNLSVEEIVWQVFAARFELGHTIDNIVFMGMGEPLDNFDNVVQAIRVLGDQRGFDIAPSRVTVSTSGHAPGITRLGRENLPNLRLAVSLNAADDALRDTLMPINKTWPLAQLKESLKTFPLKKGDIIFFEYVQLPGINDSALDAEKIARFLDGIPARLNLIPYNDGANPICPAPTSEQVERFKNLLVEQRIFVRLRQSQGRDIMAACGQLGTSRRVEV